MWKLSITFLLFSISYISFASDIQQDYLYEMREQNRILQEQLDAQREWQNEQYMRYQQQQIEQQRRELLNRNQQLLPPGTVLDPFSVPTDGGGAPMSDLFRTP